MKLRNFDWITGTYLLGYHALLAVLLPIYLIFNPIQWGMVAVALTLVVITGISITAGYHRLFSHGAYKANPIVEAVLLFFGSMATQGSALRWSFDHRLHHAYADTDRDPYTVKDGFWHAHFFWLLKKPIPLEESVVSDLTRSWMIRFQCKYYGLCMIIANLIPTLLCGWLFNDYFGAFTIVWLGRLLLSHHGTWCINSAAHYWGARNFCREQTAVDNYVISLVTFGEGYHNYHHKFAKDYRNGIRWYHFDPTKWLIWSLSKFGLATDLRRTSELRIESAMVKAQKGKLLEKLAKSPATVQASWRDTIEQLSTDITGKLANLHKLRALPTTEECRVEIAQLKERIATMLSAWTDLSKSVMRLRAA